MPEKPRAFAPEDRLIQSIRRIQRIIGLSYAYDALMLVGFCAAGYIPSSLPIAFVAICLLCLAAVALAHRTGWARGRSDPTLFLPQQLFALGAALAVAALAPQIAFQPLATLFAICAFGFMAPNVASFVVSWTAGASGALALIFLLGPRLAIPTGTLAGQALTGAVMMGLLARCIWIALFVSRLQRRLREKNAALMLAMNRIEALANLDDLTGLANRRAITGWLDEQIASVARTKVPLSLAILDIDHFKRINDSYGHQAGDRTLQAFSRVAGACLRKTDRIGRFGGEEFLVILVGAGLREAHGPLERIREALAAHDWRFLQDGANVTVTAGLAQYAPGDDADSLIRRADMALYLGKETGRDRVAVDPAQLPVLAAATA